MLPLALEMVSVMLQLVLNELKVCVELVLLVPRRIVKVAVSGHGSLLRAAFAVLLVLRAVDCRVQRSFHDRG